MTDFTQQLLTLSGEPIVQKEVSTDEKGTKKVTPVDMDILLCAKFVLLDVAEFPGGPSHKLFTAKGHQRRWHLWNKIKKDPTSVRLTWRERKLLGALLPLKYEVLIVGQIMDLL